MATIQESTVEEKIDMNTLENENLDSTKDDTSEQIENKKKKKTQH